MRGINLKGHFFTSINMTTSVVYRACLTYQGRKEETFKYDESSSLLSEPGREDLFFVFCFVFSSYNNKNLIL